MPDASQPPSAEAASAPAIKAAGLRFASDASPGIRRRRNGAGFVYLRPDGKPLRDRATLDRIRRLAIPPAYQQVWICPDPRGHIQATGRDARGRKQYRYHADWRGVRDQDKFQRMRDFGRALPALRRRLRADLARPGLPPAKVLAAVVALLESTLVRIGNAEYRRDNGSYGLTTLRDRHVRFLPHGRARFSFRGKSGQAQELELDDARLVRVVRRCQDLPGQQLFQFLDPDGKAQPIDSGQVNDYLREAMGSEFSAKDFRTWGATLRALVLLTGTALPQPASERACAACTAAVIRQVASELRNTPAVCRKSYIHPAVFDHWRAGTLPPLRSSRSLRQAEACVLAFLRRAGNKSARL